MRDGPVRFHFAAGLTSFGIGLGDIENPLNILINGVDFGDVRTLPNYNRFADNTREVYLRVDAEPGDLAISMVEFAFGDPDDRVFYDHLAMQEGTPPAAVPEPSSIVILSAGAIWLFGRGYRRRNRKSTA